jgi:hypothetical protein
MVSFRLSVAMKNFKFSRAGILGSLTDLGLFINIQQPEEDGDKNDISQ